MYAILFSTSRESPLRGPLDGAPLGDLHARGGADLDKLEAGDVVWVVQRMPGARATPGLCGRLVVGCVEERAAGSIAASALGREEFRHIRPEQQDSRRCDPFACPVIHTWGVWRRHYAGVVLLSAEQGETLEQAWRARETRS